MKQNAKKRRAAVKSKACPQQPSCPLSPERSNAEFPPSGFGRVAPSPGSPESSASSRFPPGQPDLRSEAASDSPPLHLAEFVDDQRGADVGLHSSLPGHPAKVASLDAPVRSSHALELIASLPSALRVAVRFPDPDSQNDSTLLLSLTEPAPVQDTSVVLCPLRASTAFNCACGHVGDGCPSTCVCQAAVPHMRGAGRTPRSPSSDEMVALLLSFEPLALAQGACSKQVPI